MDDATRYQMLKAIVRYEIDASGQQHIRCDLNLGPASLLPSDIDTMLDQMIERADPVTGGGGGNG